MAAIQPKYLTVAELFSNHLFRIPDYQRAYSWGRDQRSDLFSDISAIATQSGNDVQHFMATIVALRTNQQAVGATSMFWKLDIVDGQQRLTTLVLLLSAIYQSISANSDDKLNLRRLLVKGDDVTLVLLQTNHDASHFFSNFVRNGVHPNIDKAKTVSDKNILEAINECNEFVSKWISNFGNSSNLLALILHKLAFLLHEITDERVVYQVFEVLNSRGLEVQWFDRLKSILMGRAFELQCESHVETIAELKNIWSEIYRKIGLRQGMNSEALKFAATLRNGIAPSKPIGEADSVKLLRDKLTSPVEVLKIAHWILAVTTAVDWLYDNPRIKAVSDISQARLLATAIRLRDDFSKIESDNLLQTWESVCFRIYGLSRKDARTKVGDFVRLAWEVVNTQIKSDQVKERIVSIGSEFSIEKAVDALRAADCYNEWSDELRYLMYRYEESLAPISALNADQWNQIWITSSSKSIEHILPQSIAPKEHVHRLGNLMLLPPAVNSSLNDLDPIDKCTTYTQSGLQLVREVGLTIKNNSKWGISEIVDREVALIDWIRATWCE